MRKDPFKAVALLGFASGTGPTFENKTENSLRQPGLVQAIRLNIQPVPFQIEHALSVSLMFHLDRTIERFSMAKRNRWTLRSWRRCVVELPRGSLSTGVIATWRAVPFDRSQSLGGDRSDVRKNRRRPKVQIKTDFSIRF